MPYTTVTDRVFLKPEELLALSQRCHVFGNQRDKSAMTQVVAFRCAIDLNHLALLLIEQGITKRKVWIQVVTKRSVKKARKKKSKSFDTPKLASLYRSIKDKKKK